tara:strand:+ start:180 stop:992 length:813 start_codon:yes stop_codon:yes gene_type:complete
MKILLSINDLIKAIVGINNLGFVPTMGSIHDGHKSLINKSKRRCKKTIVSIYVNPKQFNKKKDFESYPRNLKKDLKILKEKKVDYVFIPQTIEIYKKKRLKKIILKRSQKILCAKFRKGHFEGVLDIMDRLLDLIKPKYVFMGKKDFQQLYLIEKFFAKKYNCKFIKCKTIRNKNYLALSSRNNLLSKKNYSKAENVSKYLFNLNKNLKNSKTLNHLLLSKKNYLENKYKVKVEYLEQRNESNLKISKKNLKKRLFISYYINKIRLIDNF